MDNVYANTWEYKIKRAFRKKEKFDKIDILWEIVSLILYQESNSTILIEVYKLFKDKKDDFIRLISLLDGRKFVPPTKRELEEALLLAVLYYEKEIEGKDWTQIKNEFDFDFSSVKYGIRIKNLDNWIKQKIQEIIRREGFL